MTEAETLIESPTDELRATCAELQRISEASKSESRTDLQFEDGSVLVVTSFQGDECEMLAVAPPEEPVE